MHKLDNPLWNALTTRHSYLAIGNDLVRRYPPEVAPFVAIPDLSETSLAELRNLVSVGETVCALRELPDQEPGWEIQNQFNVVQYIWDDSTEAWERHPEVISLTSEHLDAMLELVALVYPAYFRKGTAELGPYVGISREGRLCGMAGIRMSMDGFQEISAVCTHPEFRGKGFAGILTRHLVHQILEAGDVPFLHTEEDNKAAQSVYERIGFRRRRMIPVRVMTRI